MRLVASFVEFAHQRGWRIAILGASEARARRVSLARAARAYHGDEAVVDTQSFSLDGRPIRKVRQSVHRLARCGFTVAGPPPERAPRRAARGARAHRAEWRGDAPERGFVMALDALFALGDDDAVFLVGYDAEGRDDGPTALLHLARRLRALVVDDAAAARRAERFHQVAHLRVDRLGPRAGYARVSLNFSPFAALLAPGATLTSAQRVQVAVLRRTKRWFQLDNLLLFNRKFFPEWERRYVVYERRRDLPRVGVAALAAESYLPFQ